MGRLSSRKLAAAVSAMVVILALMVSLSMVLPSIFTESPALVGSAIFAIAGLGGFVSWRQSIVDEKTPTFRIDESSTVVRSK